MEKPGVVATIGELRTVVGAWRRQGARVGLVPTMGALHAGHLSLASLARNLADRVVVSIFVNPAQFAPHEDFERYPRDIEADRCTLAAGAAADLVFAPAADEIYPDGFATSIEIGGPAMGLESDFRPHFLSGVATVVAKLLIAAAPDVAVFGEKDYQQLLVVRRLAQDLGLPIEIAGAAIVREPDGLAMSSRNAYLGADERRIAGQIHRMLGDVATHVREGSSIAQAESLGKDTLLAAGFDSVDYVAVRDAATLARPERPGANMRVLAAAAIGGTRLIDNIPA